MYLTRLQLDHRNALARRDLADPYDMHRTLVRAFVRDSAQAPPRILWRAEPGSAWSAPIVLVQSLAPADWTALGAMPGYLQAPAETKMLQPASLLQHEGRYRFRLFANPTVSRAGKRYGLVSDDAQLAWLSRQGQRLGFAVEAALVTASDVLKSRKGGMPICLQRTGFEGVLKVVDVDAMAQALQTGIGPGKAFGCGLLSLARCR